VSCDSNERHTPDVANPAEDLIAHSLKKGEEQSNIPPKKQPNTTQPPTFTRQRNIAPGRTRRRGYKGAA
jgi:hypothetical protein